MSEVKEPLFKIGAVLKHVKSGKEYNVTGTPYTYRLEATGAPAYAYQAAYRPPVDPNDQQPTDIDLRIWVRDQVEMEDGRFVQVRPGW